MTAAALKEPGTKQLLMGNEAIARGAMEAGAGVAAAYPGNPSTEVIDTLASVANDLNMYVEWSVNEKVALEVAAGASYAGVRSITAMKQLGLNVALDFLANVNLTGVKAGLVLVVCDDPSALSSTNEQDSRNVARALDLPLLEPSDPQEAKEMTKWAFELSEQIGGVCLVRSVTRISHSRGIVVLGELGKINDRAFFDPGCPPYTTIVGGGAPKYHKALHDKLDTVAAIYDSSRFNWYEGPEKPRLLIVTSGSGWLYSWEAVRRLSLTESVGILKLGTTWPLPRVLLKDNMAKVQKVLVVEEVDPFLEGNLKGLAFEWPEKDLLFYGKQSGHIDPFGEINTDIVSKALAGICGVEYVSREADYRKKAADIIERFAPPRETQFCAGCPHRGLFWAVKDALRLDGRGGIVTGDIGCYGSAAGPTGFSQLKTMHSMGSGIGVANGLGKLERFQFVQPVLAACGDSTFFHAAIPALVNAIHSRANFILLVLDNSGTAMTGFQPHPGTLTDATGSPAPAVDIASLCRGLGLPVEVVDPYDIKGTTEKLLSVLGGTVGPTVMISKRECALITSKGGKRAYNVSVTSEQCVGESCGCDRFCTRVFRCPGLIWERNSKKAEIDMAICIGCGVCADVCPHHAIRREESQ